MRRSTVRAVVGVVLAVVLASAAAMAQELRIKIDDPPPASQPDRPGPVRLLGPPDVAPPEDAPLPGGRKLPRPMLPREGQPGPQGEPGPQGDKADRDRLTADVGRGQLVLVGTVENVQALMQTMSEPPRVMMNVTLKDARMLRGEAPDPLAFGYSATQGREYFPNAGDKVIVVADKPAPAAANLRPGRGPMMNRLARPAGVTALLIVQATDENVKLATRLAALPVGWSLNDKDQPVSPWATLGGKGWPNNTTWTPPRVETRCAVTGRPALMAGQGVELSVEQIIPDDKQQYVNPFGDGQFKVTVTNTTDKPVEVPALLSDGKGKILWADSLVVLNAGKPRLLPGAGAVPGDVKPVTLKAGQSVETVVDTLKLSGINWPRGGSRVAFTFAMGELSRDNFFYYLSKHHDKLRGPDKVGRSEPHPAKPPQPLPIFVDPKDVVE